MIIGRGLHRTQIYAFNVNNLSKAVHCFAHLAHGTYRCTAYSKYGSVQSARDMNLSLTVKPPTEISVSPDTVSSVMSASISTCDLLVETRNLCFIDKFNFSRMHLRIFTWITLHFLLLLWARSTIIFGKTCVATFTVMPNEIPDILLGNNFVFFRSLLLLSTIQFRCR